MQFLLRRVTNSKQTARVSVPSCYVNQILAPTKKRDVMSLTFQCICVCVCVVEQGLPGPKKVIHHRMNSAFTKSN